MALKLFRSYLLTVQTQSSEDSNGLTQTPEYLIVQPPFTIEFDITRNIATSANVCQIRIFNLSADNRNNLRFNIFNIYQYRSIQLRAGYSLNPPINANTGIFQLSQAQVQSGFGTNLPIIFQGNLTAGSSVREGVNFVTTLECFDGGFAFDTGITNTTFPGPNTPGGDNGTPVNTIIQSLMTSLPNVTVGAIGSGYTGNIPRGRALNGNTVDLLRDYTGGGFFIDTEKGYALGTNECLQGDMPLINSSAGLLGTPVLELNQLTFDMVFEPRIIPAQLIQLESSTDKNFNGFYKINSIKHRGMISPSVCGEVITSLGMYTGIGPLATLGAL